MTSQDISPCLEFGDNDRLMIDIKQLPLTGGRLEADLAPNP